MAHSETADSPEADEEAIANVEEGINKVSQNKVHPKNAFETRCIESAEVIPKKVAKDEDFHFAASGVESCAKIYGFRVDRVHEKTEVLRAQIASGDPEDPDEPDKPDKPDKRKVVSATCKSASELNMGDDWFSAGEIVEPYFQNIADQREMFFDGGRGLSLKLMGTATHDGIPRLIFDGRQHAHVSEPGVAVPPGIAPELSKELQEMLLDSEFDEDATCQGEDLRKSMRDYAGVVNWRNFEEENDGFQNDANAAGDFEPFFDGEMEGEAHGRADPEHEALIKAHFELVDADQDKWEKDFLERPNPVVPVQPEARGRPAKRSKVDKQGLSAWWKEYKDEPAKEYNGIKLSLLFNVRQVRQIRPLELGTGWVPSRYSFNDFYTLDKPMPPQVMQIKDAEGGPIGEDDADLFEIPMPLDEANVEDMERRAAAEQMDLRREKHDESADREERANMETAFVKGRRAKTTHGDIVSAMNETLDEKEVDGLSDINFTELLISVRRRLSEQPKAPGVAEMFVSLLVMANEQPAHQAQLDLDMQVPPPVKPGLELRALPTTNDQDHRNWRYANDDDFEVTRDDDFKVIRDLRATVSRSGGLPQTPEAFSVRKAIATTPVLPSKKTKLNTDSAKKTSRKTSEPPASPAKKKRVAEECSGGALNPFSNRSPEEQVDDADREPGSGGRSFDSPSPARARARSPPTTPSPATQD
jgi:hypothetical protein